LKIVEGTFYLPQTEYLHTKAERIILMIFFVSLIMNRAKKNA